MIQKHFICYSCRWKSYMLFITTPRNEELVKKKVIYIFSLQLFPYLGIKSKEKELRCYKVVP